MRSTRRGERILAIPSLIVLLVMMFAGTAGAQTILDQGSSDDLVAPPAPDCATGSIVLVEEVSFTAAGSPIEAPVLGVGNGLETELELSDFDEVDPGILEITEIITYDAHTGRALWPVQDNERVAIEFLLDGEVVGATDFTPDLEDGVNSAWVVAELGEVELAEGADEARIVHFNEANNNDSVVVASACATFSADDGLEANDDEDGETLTLAELIERNAADNDEGPDGDELAMTGANEIAFAVIALGVIIFGIAFKIQSQDPEQLTF